MDSKIVRRGVALIIVAIILVFGVVYLANTDRFRRSGTASGNTAETEEVPEEDPRGLQIGDNLKAFLMDPDFFDPVSTPADVIEEEVVTVTPHFAVEGRAVTIRIVDSMNRLVTGQAFSVMAVQAEETVHRAEMIYTDSDMDGIIRIGELPGGEWDFTMQTILGFRIPTEETRISIEKDAAQEEDSAGETSSAETDAEEDGGTGATAGTEASGETDAAGETDTAGEADTAQDNETTTGTAGGDNTEGTTESEETDGTN